MCFSFFLALKSPLFGFRNILLHQSFVKVYGVECDFSDVLPHLVADGILWLEDGKGSGLQFIV